MAFEGDGVRSFMLKGTICRIFSATFVICIFFMLVSAHLAYVSKTRIARKIFLGASDNRLGDDVIFEPEFDLAAINAFCRTNISATTFTSCKSKYFGPIEKNGTVPDLQEKHMLWKSYDPMVFPSLYVLGERHSGTNLAATMVTDNFDVILNGTLIRRKSKYHPSLTDYGPNRHKHEMQSDEGYYHGFTVLSVRNPYDYVRSMQRICFHCGNEAFQRNVRKLDPDDFVNMAIQGGHEVGYQFKDIFDMRQRKFCNHIRTAAERTDCVLLVRQEDNILKHQQEKYIWRIAKMTGWPLQADVAENHERYSGWTPGKNSITTTGLITDSIMLKSRSQYNDDDRRIVEAVNKKIDVRFESMLGYSKISVPLSVPRENTRNDKTEQQRDGKRLEGQASTRREPQSRNGSG